MFRVLTRVFECYPARAWFAALALGSWSVAMLGLELQQLLRLAPCPYCIFQRVLYYLIAFTAALGVVWPFLTRVWVAMIVLMAGAGGLLAAYQSWMQLFPAWATECSYTNPGVIERIVDWLGMQWPALFLATGFCSSKEWVFAGLSMANWSVLLFIAILAYVMALWPRKAD